MLCVMSRRPGFKFSILAGWVWFLLDSWQLATELRTAVQSKTVTYLGIFAALEEWGHADQAYIVVPHDRILIVITRYLKDVLEHCMEIVSIESWTDGNAVGGQLQQVLTFKTLTTCFLVEVLLATVVRYVATILLDLSPRVYLVPLDLPERALVQALKRRKVYRALGLGLDEASGVLDHPGVF